MWRHLFALGPLILLCTMILGPRGLGGRPHELHYGKHLAAASSHAGTLDTPMTNAGLICGESAAIFFVIDSFRRKYRGNAVIALTLSVAGLFTLGLTSLLYYVVWGYRPLEPAAQVYGNQFCPQCLAETTDRSAPGSLALNIMLGTRYMGSSQLCRECRSVVRTLWFWLVVPVIPLGSYRVIATNGNHFIGRRTITPHWTQISMVYGIALSALFLVVMIYAAHH